MYRPLLIALSLAAFVAPAPAQTAPSDRSLAELYALAVARLLGEPATHTFVLLPTSAHPDVTVRARAATSDPYVASPGIASEVARRLRAMGYAGTRGVAAGVQRTTSLQLVLGQLRFEPAAERRFARVALGVIGSDGTLHRVNFLLRHDDNHWIALSSRVVGGP